MARTAPIPRLARALRAPAAASTVVFKRLRLCPSICRRTASQRAWSSRRESSSPKKGQCRRWTSAHCQNLSHIWGRFSCRERMVRRNWGASTPTTAESRMMRNSPKKVRAMGRRSLGGRPSILASMQHRGTLITKARAAPTAKGAASLCTAASHRPARAGFCRAQLSSTQNTAVLART